MTTEELKDIARRWYEEVGNAKDIQAVESYLAPEFVNRTAPPGVPNDRDGYKQLLSMYAAAFPDYEADVEDVVAENDKVALRFRIRGTHRGALMGIPATNERIDIMGKSFLHLKDGRITEQWETVDMMGLMQQIGVMSPPGAPAD